MFKNVVFVLLIIYSAFATFFVWQYFHEPTLKICWDYPQAKLLQLVPESAYAPDPVVEGQEAKPTFWSNLKSNFAQTVAQGNQLITQTQIFSEATDLETASLDQLSNEQLSTTLGEDSIPALIADWNKYQYCQQFTSEYETRLMNKLGVKDPNLIKNLNSLNALTNLTGGESGGLSDSLGGLGALGNLFGQ